MALQYGTQKLQNWDSSRGRLEEWEEGETPLHKGRELVTVQSLVPSVAIKISKDEGSVIILITIIC